LTLSSPCEPICEIETGRPVAFEALARWRHPARGLVQPGVFIPLAEQSGAILALGEQILAKSCALAASWPETLPVSVNLSPVQFRRPEYLVATVKEILARTGLAPARLYLEITESLLMEDTAQTRAAVEELARFGVRFALDDFGAGYSSLSYIQSYPFAKIKLDKKFVDQIETHRTSAAIVVAVRILSERIGVELVAEGVETERQHLALRALGITLAQGFLFGRPAREAQFLERPCDLCKIA
jgi:EAL domain-containing protein (putative c-di-GMP-specific phosphodiesterase class I)